MRSQRLRLRAPVLLLLLSTAVVPDVAIAAPAAPATYATFDKSIADTKKAMMADPEQALVSAAAAVALAKRLPPSRKAEVAVATAEWLHGESLLFTNKLAEAEPIVAATLRQVERIAPGTKLHGDLLRSYGEIAASGGRVIDALKAYQRAHEVFRTAGEARSRAMALQDIGGIFWEARDYAKVLDYYEQSAEVFSNDPTLTLTMHNNRAEVFREQKRFPAAAAAYRAAMVQARKLDSGMLQTRILTNLAGSEADAGRIRSAELAINQALALAQHGEAAGWRPFVVGVAAKIAFERGDLTRARQLIGRTFIGVDIDRSEMLFRDYHRTAARIHEAAGDDKQAYAHLKAFQRLDSEAQALNASAASQLLAARFDFANQNLKISQLKETQLKRDVETRTTLLTGIIGAGAVIFALMLLGFFSIRRSRNQVRGANTLLSNANGALETALKAKTEFLATTSHEIRTPLNGILGMTQVLLADRRIQSDIRERIEVVHGAGETMRALVDDILDVAKIESGSLSVVHQPTDLTRILGDVAQLWQGQAQSKGIALRVAIDAAPPRILSDEGRLRQITFNLLSNAIKFTSTGHVTFAAEAQPTEGGEELVITVSDTGIGIPADQLDAIFEAFAQVDGGTTRQYGGTGLGLAIVRSLARALGGDITVASVLGEGTTFTLRLPLERIGADTGAAMASRSATLDEATLLIVERDPQASGMMRMLLAAEVGSTQVAVTTEEALETLASGGVDHVLADAATIIGDDDPEASLRALVEAARVRHAHVTLLIGAELAATLPGVATLGAQVAIRPIGVDDLLLAMATLYPDDVTPAAVQRAA